MPARTIVLLALAFSPLPLIPLGCSSDLPATLDEALLAPPSSGTDRDVALVRFRPHRIGPDFPDGAAQPWPHIRLDRALEFLLGDRLE